MGSGNILNHIYSLENWPLCHGLAQKAHFQISVSKWLFLLMHLLLLIPQISLKLYKEYNNKNIFIMALEAQDFHQRSRIFEKFVGKYQADGGIGVSCLLGRWEGFFTTRLGK